MAHRSLTLPLYTIDGTETASVALSPTVFAVAVNDTLVSETLVSAQANRRHAIANTKTRGFVSGGGRKPWRQKGTGRARAGSTRSPLWRHGGVVFGPSSARVFSRKINQKARQAVVRMLLSALNQSGELRVIDQLSGETLGTTKVAARFLHQAAGAARRPLLLTHSADKRLLRGFRNLDGVMVRSLERLGLLDLALTDHLVLDRAALEGLTERYATEGREESKNSAANETLNAQRSTPAPKRTRSTPSTQLRTGRSARSGSLPRARGGSDA